MKSKGVERASARPGELCPDGDFGRVAAAVDEAERIAGQRKGGPSDGDISETGRLERRLYRLRPSSAADWAWLARRLARAIENGWHRDAINPLLRVAD